MSTPDQPPLKIGEDYYLKRVSVYHQCTLLSLRSTDDFEHTAKVRYYSDGEPLVCRQSELITWEQYKAMLKQRAREAYKRELPFRRKEARIKYEELIKFWEQGMRLPELVKLWNETPKAVGAKIAAAKRWELIVEDKAGSQ